MAVVGVGYFGAYHCGKLAAIDGVSLDAVVDIDVERARAVADRFGAAPFGSLRALRGRVEAAVVAVPTSSHHDVAARLLEDGLDLLVEKPLATTVAEADNLCRLVARHARRLQVGHLERFNPALAVALDRVERPRYVRMERYGPFPGRGGDVDVVLELMTHDLDILLHMARAPVESVEAVGWNVLTGHLDVVSARLRFADGLTADLFASRVGASRCRRFVVLDALGALDVDLASRTVCRTGCGPGVGPAQRHVLDSCDPLLEQDRDFIDVLQNGRQPRVNETAGREAVALAARIHAAVRPPALSPPAAGNIG